MGARKYTALERAAGNYLHNSEPQREPALRAKVMRELARAGQVSSEI